MFSSSRTTRFGPLIAGTNSNLSIPALGYTKSGRLIFLQVDGIETHSGVTLEDMADVMLQLGAHSAVNLDGGGSSVSTYKSKIVDKPHCADTQVICERSVSTITCVN